MLCGHEHRQACAHDFGKDSPEPEPRRNIEAVKGVVENEERGIAKKRVREQCFAQFTIRQINQLARLQRVKIKRAQDLPVPPPKLALITTAWVDFKWIDAFDAVLRKIVGDCALAFCQTTMPTRLIKGTLGAHQFALRIW